jgi:hypothetical protein
METTERAARAQVNSIICNLDFEKLQACTTATGLATAPILAEAAIDGMWLFLGVQVDALSLKPQPVRLLEVPDDGAPIHVLLADQGRRVLVTSNNGREDVLNRLAQQQIVVEWNTEVGHGC